MFLSDEYHANDRTMSNLLEVSSIQLTKKRFIL